MTRSSVRADFTPYHIQLFDQTIVRANDDFLKTFSTACNLSIDEPFGAFPISLNGSRFPDGPAPPHPATVNGPSKDVAELFVQSGVVSLVHGP